MPERTTRGEEDRKREDEQMVTGETASQAAPTDPDERPVSMTRDKSVEPLSDGQRDAPGGK